MGELDDHGKEEKSEFKEDLQAPVPESSATATPDPLTLNREKDIYM